MFKSKHKETVIENSEVLITADNKEFSDNLFNSNRKTVKELVAPVGINPNPLEYMVLYDNETSIYTLCYYIHKMPKNATFAQTFSSLYNYPNVTSCTFIEPMIDGKASKILDHRVTSIETELVEATKIGDSNRIRKLNAKLEEANIWANNIETGNNALYEVAFLYILQDTVLDNLYVKASDFHSRAREKGIDLVACYSAHPEAFLSGYPTNKIFVPSLGPLKGLSIKRHIMDRFALSTIFNHTKSRFSHKNGIPIGHNIYDNQLVLYDPYDTSHDGYGVVFVGKTGSGKSASVKMFNTRFIDFGFKIRSIDFERKGSAGEYTNACNAAGGVNFQLSTNSNNILNLYELDVEDIYDETTQTEYQTLNLSATLSNIRNLEIVLLKDGKDFSDFSMFVFIKSLIDDINKELFAELGIVDGIVESLYTNEIVTDGVIYSGKTKKKLPTLTDFYKKLLIKKANNNNELYTLPYQIMADGFKDFVRCIYYAEYDNDIIFLSEEEYAALPSDSSSNCKYIIRDDKRIYVNVIKGNRPYFDGQSNFYAGPDTPWINIDISLLPAHERNTALLIALNYFDENCVKKNSENIMKASKMIILIDELSKTFGIKEARVFISEAYRTFRKRNVSPWALTQMLSDFEKYEETKDILKNATSVFMLKQNVKDKAFIKSSTPLTDTQVDKVCTLGADGTKGELCLIDNNRVVFLQVDYLEDSEALVVETDVNKIKQLYKGYKSV